MKRAKALSFDRPIEELSFPRRKCIIIEDSFKKHVGIFDKRSKVINPRNPFVKDLMIIDYDMDSEEEWNEENGEDLENPNKEEDEEEDDDEGDVEMGFIVPDDYLS